MSRQLNCQIGIILQFYLQPTTRLETSRTLPLISVFAQFKLQLLVAMACQSFLVLFDLSRALNPRSCDYRGFRGVGYGMEFSVSYSIRWRSRAAVGFRIRGPRKQFGN